MVAQYNITSCYNIESKQTVEDTLGYSLDDYYCPDFLPNETMTLGGDQNNASNFNLILGDCNDLKYITYNQNCVDTYEILNLLNTTKVEFKALTQIPNGNIYINSSLQVAYNTRDLFITLKSQFSIYARLEYKPIIFHVLYNIVFSGFE